MWDMYGDDYGNMEGCPPDFASNCALGVIGCPKCSANGKGDRLLYQPISPDLPLKSHPTYAKPVKETKVKDAKARAYNRKGRSIEKKIMKELGAKSTYMSGATNHDGDGHITIKGFKYRIGHKNRFNNRNTLGPTSSEMKQDKAMGITIWVTSSEKDGSIVTMSKELFEELLGYINE
jgi:hypothetical protein